MIIWTGYGFAVVLYALVGMLIGGALGDVLETDAGWTFALGLLVGAAANHLTAKKLDSSTKTLIDPETGQNVVLKRGDSLFWVPMKYWSYVILGLAVLMLFGGSQGR